MAKPNQNRNNRNVHTNTNLPNPLTSHQSTAAVSVHDPNGNTRQALKDGNPSDHHFFPNYLMNKNYSHRDIECSRLGLCVDGINIDNKLSFLFTSINFNVQAVKILDSP